MTPGDIARGYAVPIAFAVFGLVIAAISQQVGLVLGGFLGGLTVGLAATSAALNWSLANLRAVRALLEQESRDE